MVHESFEFAGPYGVLELAYGFCLDLSDALAFNLEDSADFLSRVAVAVADPVSQLDNLALAV